MFRALFLMLAALALPAAAQFPPPSLLRTHPEVTGERIAKAGIESMTVYVTNPTAGEVTVFDQSGVVRRIRVGNDPRFIAVGNGRFFVSNAGDGTVSVQTGEATVASVPAGGSGPLVADGDIAYMIRRQDGAILRIDRAALQATPLQTGAVAPVALALGGGKLFISDATGLIFVADISSGSSQPPMASARLPGRPGPVTYASRHAYVLTDNSEAPLVEVDPVTLATTRIAMPGHGRDPRAIAANGGAVFAGFGNELVIFDPAARTLLFIPTAAVVAIHAESIGGLTFVLDAANNLHVIDARTMRNHVVALPVRATDVTATFKLCRAYVAGEALALVNAPCSDFAPSGINAQGLWWVPAGAESGWGLNLAHQGNTVFGTWFTYDAAGNPLWLVMSNGVYGGHGTFEGALFQTTGPSFAAPSFDASRIGYRQVGTLRIDLGSVTHGRLTATIDGTTITKEIGKQQFAVPMPVCGTEMTPGAAPNYTDLWWASPPGSESGWGVNVQHQGDILFITWFTYDTDGRPLWLVGSDVRRTGNATYSGTLYRTAGPPVAASPWDPSRVQRIPTGSVTFDFRDAANGTFSYTVGTISGTKPITRQVFAAPQSACR